MGAEALDMGDADDLQLIRRRAGVGVAAFALREALVRIVTLASGLVLARVLGPEAFGLYAIAWFVVHLFSHFSDVGLGDALVSRAWPWRRLSGAPASGAWLSERLQAVQAPLPLLTGCRRGARQSG